MRNLYSITKGPGDPRLRLRYARQDGQARNAEDGARELCRGGLGHAWPGDMAAGRSPTSATFRLARVAGSLRQSAWLYG
jgi:hypothetical protein